jgi:hypothetical protein
MAVSDRSNGEQVSELTLGIYLKEGSVYVSQAKCVEDEAGNAHEDQRHKVLRYTYVELG